MSVNNRELEDSIAMMTKMYDEWIKCHIRILDLMCKNMCQIQDDVYNFNITF